MKAESKIHWWEELPDEDISIILQGRKEVNYEIKSDGGFTLTVNNNLQKSWMNPREMGRLVDQSLYGER